MSRRRIRLQQVGQRASGWSVVTRRRPVALLGRRLADDRVGPMANRAGPPAWLLADPTSGKPEAARTQAVSGLIDRLGRGAGDEMAAGRGRSAWPQSLK
jgi:hypothetical protein